MMKSIDECWKELTPSPIIGVDEVGRGCLAGPVYAGAVVFNHFNDIEKYLDSKMLSAKRREELSAKIKVEHICGIGFASVEEISRYNIFQASLLAMKRAIESLGLKNSGHILVDGKFRIKGLDGFKQTPVIQGDKRIPVIGAASIYAKVARDELLVKLSKEFPQYGFEKHKGYATAFHKKAIRDYGACSEHRPTFSGVREYL